MPRACAVRTESKLPDTGVPLPDPSMGIWRGREQPRDVVATDDRAQCWCQQSLQLRVGTEQAPTCLLGLKVKTTVRCR